MLIRSTRIVLRGLLALLLAGCGRSQTPTVAKVQNPTASAGPPPAKVEYPLAIAERSPQQRYEGDLAAAMALFRDEKLPEAYSALKRAQSVQDTPLVQSVLATIEARAEFAQVANAAGATIAAFIAEGRVELASHLIRDSLRVLGGSGVGPYFALLQRQVDALETAGAEPATKAARFQKNLEESIAGNFMRNGVLAFEQALFLSNDPRVRRAYEEVRTRLRRYEEAMIRGAQIRRDPSRRPEFLAAMREAAELWPTLDIARMADEVSLVDQGARDRVVLLDFDVHGNSDAIGAARAVARDLTTALRGRYDVVDRSEWSQVATELGLSNDQITDDDAARREFAKRANVRYLVVGEVFAANGIIVRGRFLDAGAGAVLQTSRIIGLAPDSIEPCIPQFVAMLLMNDEQRWAYESQLARLGSPAPAIAAPGDLPKPPELAAPNAPPRIFAASVRHPETGPAVLDSIRSRSTLSPSRPTLADDHPLRDQVSALAIERGDDLLRRGLYLAAQSQYLRAYEVSRNPLDLMPRLDRCRPHVPAGDGSTGKPRIIFCDFAVGSGFESPGAGPCLSDIVAAYAASSFFVIDRAELNWCMERLGLTYRDVVSDPNVLFYLSRALDARYVAFGRAARHGPGFEAALTVFDAETGSQASAVRVHADSWPDLRHRLDELVDPTAWSAATTNSAAEQQIDSLLSEARKHAYFKNFSTALDLTREAIPLRPHCIRIQTTLEAYERQIRQMELADEREATTIRRQSLLHADRAPRVELFRRLEAARSTTSSQPIADSDRLRRRDQAHSQLIAHARTARSDGDYELAVHLMSAAIALQARPELETEFAQVRRQFVSQHRVREAKEAMARDQDRQRQRESELAAIKTRLDVFRKDRADRQQAWKTHRDDNDRREHSRLLTEARSTLADDARHLWLLQSARRLSPAGDSERLLVAARLAQARAVANQRGSIAELETRLTTELAARPQLDSTARRNQNFYAEALKNGEQALRFSQYERAGKLFTEALRCVQTDDALRGLRAAQDEQQRAKELADTRAAAERNANADVDKLVETGRTAFEQGRFDEALSAFRRARAAAPTNADVANWIARIEKAQLDQLAAERRRPGDPGPSPAVSRSPTSTPPASTAASSSNPETKTKSGETTLTEVKTESSPAAQLDPAARLRADFEKLVEQGLIALSFRRFEEAEMSLDSAVRLIPGDAGAIQLLAQARKKIGPPPEFVRHMQAAAAHEKQERYGDALQAYRDALRLDPTNGLALRRADYVQRMDAGFKAMRANNRHQAAMEFESALTAIPNDSAATRALSQAKKQ